MIKVAASLARAKPTVIGAAGAANARLPESAPILIDGRSDVPGPTFTATRDLGTGVNWIERTYADDTKRVLLSQGICGQEGEQTLFIDRPDAKLASTGFDGATVAALAGASMLLGAGPIAWRRRPAWARRKRVEIGEAS